MIWIALISGTLIGAVAGGVVGYVFGYDARGKSQDDAINAACDTHPDDVDL